MRPYNPERFRELIIYVAGRMERTGHKGSGRIKLAKMLWLSDFEAYLRLGDSLTGARYLADKYGPSPPEELIQSRTLNPETEFAYERGFRRQKLPRAKRAVRPGVFDERELALVNEVVDRYRDWTGDDVVNKVAHTHPGYKLVEPGQEVPYDSVFISTELPPERAVELGRQLIREGKLGNL
jgi:Protein of unknown function (DUF4065)